MYLGHPNLLCLLEFIISSLNFKHDTLTTELNPFECTIGVKKTNQAEAEGCLRGENGMRVHRHTPGAL